MKHRLWLRQWWLPTLAMVVGLSSSMAIALLVSRWELASDRLQFQRRTETLATALQRSLNRYTDVLYALGDLYLVKEQQVSPQEFNRFVRRSLLNYPGIQALEWAPQVTQDERMAFESEMRSRVDSRFTITERTVEGQISRAGERSHYIPVTYVQPLRGNEPALGFDLASDETRRSALESARDTGAMTASARIRLVQEAKDQFGFLVFLPVYREKPNTLETRRQQIRGYLLGVFRVSDVVEDSLEELSYDINFYVYDQSAEPQRRFLGFYDAAQKAIAVDPGDSSELASDWLQPQCESLAYCVHALTVAERQWAIQFLPADTYPSPLPTAAIATLIIGALLTGLLTLYLMRSQTELQRTKELSELKLRLFSLASHEFRTPLSTILISAQSLETAPEHALSEPQRAKIHTRIRSSAKRLNQLLSDLLTLTRAEAGKLDFSPELIHLPQFCQKIIDDVQGSIEQPRMIEFEYRLEGDRAFADPKLLQSILTNLLSNAVKYSASDQPIRFQVVSQGEGLEFHISDRGIGIPVQDQAHLYDAFYRGRNVGTVSGTGLGLAVVESCIRLHQGHMTVASQAGQGTTFIAVLPNYN
ncbi:MAG: CHASE domain-containing protein [Elainellaceae cyanobacterium]